MLLINWPSCRYHIQSEGGGAWNAQGRQRSMWLQSREQRFPGLLLGSFLKSMIAECLQTLFAPCALFFKKTGSTNMIYGQSFFFILYTIFPALCLVFIKQMLCSI